MRNAVTMLAAAVVLGLICGEAMAQCPLSGGGGMRSGGMRSGGMRSGGTTRVGMPPVPCGGGGCAKAKAKSGKDEFQKWALPAAADVVALDTSKYDSAAGALELSDSQIKKLEEAKSQLRADAERLANAQKEARAAYDKACGQAACTEAYRKVLAAAEACRNFNSNQNFNQTLFATLTDAQTKKFRGESPAKKPVTD